MSAALINGLLPRFTDKHRARALGLTLRTVRRYATEGIPSRERRVLARRLQWLLEERLAELAEIEPIIKRLTEGDDTDLLANPGPRSGISRPLAEARRGMVRGEGQAGGRSE